MAKAIKHIETKQRSELEQQTESLQEILALIATNGEAIKATLEIVQELHHAGILDIMRGMLKTRDKIGVIAMDQLNQPSMHNTIKNAINTLQFIGELDPDKTKRLLQGITHGLDNINTQEEGHKIGLIKAMRDPNVKASITTAITFLQGMGEGMDTKKPLH